MVKRRLAEVVQKALEFIVPEGTCPVLFGFQAPEKVVEAKEKKLLREKKLLKLQKEMKVHRKDTDLTAEKALKTVALKGLLKLFNEVSEKQTQYKRDKKMKNERKQCKSYLAERFKRRMGRLKVLGNKTITEVMEPKWNVLREDFSKVPV